MDYQEPKCDGCSYLSRDVQFEEWDCEHPKRPPHKSTATPRAPRAPEWCPLRRPGPVCPPELEGKRGQLNDMMGFLADAGSALYRGEIAARNAQLEDTAKKVARMHNELLEMRRGLARIYDLEV
jgi:hypothetical protein